MKPNLRLRLIRGLRLWLEGPKQTLHERYPAYEIGVGSYGDLTVLDWGEGSTLRIGSYTSIGTEVKVLLGGEHRMDWVTTFPFSALWDSQRQVKGHPKSKGDVVIGSDVWIANEALIMSGVEVGHGAIIGARAIVTKNVPAYAVVAGNPARIVKFRFDQLTIGRLLKVKWWEWEAARIENALPALLNEDIEAFLSAAESGRF